MQAALRQATIGVSVCGIALFAVALGSACSGKENETVAPPAVDSGSGDVADTKVADTKKEAEPVDTAEPCDPPRVKCLSGACADLTNDAYNCGECGKACTGTYVCKASKCVCPTGKTECTNLCYDLTKDPTHCGACDVDCGIGGKCVDSKCVGGA